MSLLFYEQSTKCLVSISSENGVETKITSQAEAPPNVPVVNREQSPLADTDIYVLDSLNSGSRAGNKEGIYQQAIEPIFSKVYDLPHTYVATSSASSVAEFASSFADNGKPVSLIVISGDTSLCEIVNSLKSGNGLLNVFIVPAGTGNSLALSIGIANQVQAVERILFHRKEDLKPLNIYEADFPSSSKLLLPDGTSKEIHGPMSFLVVTSWGFHASLVADSDTKELRKFGLERFKIAAQSNLARKQEYKGDFKIVQGNSTVKERAGPFAYFVVTSSKKFEPTFEISPRGDILDPNLYVVGFKTEDSDSYIMDIMNAVYDGGRHIEDERVFYDKVSPGDEIILSIAKGNAFENSRFCVDGAIVVSETDGELKIKNCGSEKRGWKLTIAT